MQVRDATVGPLSGTSPVSAAFTSTCVVRHAERVGHDLREHRARALADLGAARRACARRVAVSSSDAFDASFDLAAAGEARAVEEQREADAAIRAGAAPCGACAEVRALHRLAQHLASALQSAPSVWPVAVVSPGRSAFDLAKPHRDRGRAARRCAPCALRPRTASAARRSRGTRRSAACSSARRGRGCGRGRSDTVPSRGARRATARRR